MSPYATLQSYNSQRKSWSQLKPKSKFYVSILFVKYWMLPIAAQHEPTHAPHKNTDLNFISKETRKHWFFCRWYFLARNKNFTAKLSSTLMQSSPDIRVKALLIRNMYTYAHILAQCPPKGLNQWVVKNHYSVPESSNTNCNICTYCTEHNSGGTPLNMGCAFHTLLLLKCPRTRVRAS